jgi:ribonuclease HII
MSQKNNKDWVCATIIDDDDDDDYNDVNYSSIQQQIDVQSTYISTSTSTLETIITPIEKKKRTKNIQNTLSKWFNPEQSIIELGIDEAGRGPMFGRVYAGVAILPKDDSFDHSLMKDSKKFHSKKKIEEVADYIKSNSIAWAVEYEDEQVIDEINILQATQSAMHKAIKTVLKKLKDNYTDIETDKLLLLVDGNYFKPFTTINKTKTKMETIKYELVEGGDNKYTPIAAASILAKVERDKYIEELCILNPELIEHYGIDSNKGYGSKKHMDGIKEYGITKWHRRTFGICRNYS